MTNSVSAFPPMPSVFRVVRRSGRSFLVAVLTISAFLSAVPASAEPRQFGFLIGAPAGTRKPQSSEPRQSAPGKLIALPKHKNRAKQPDLETASISTSGRTTRIVRGGQVSDKGDALRNVRLTAARYRHHPAVKASGLTPAEWTALFQAMIWQESRFVVTARSHKGAMGLAQLMPGTARMLGVDPGDPIQNLDGGARYLLTQLQDFRSPTLALAAYNAGPEAVRKYGGVPPYRETRDYVVRIFAYHDQLMAQN